MNDKEVEATFKKGLEFLLSEGYSYEEMSTTESEASGKYYNLKYKSEEAKRAFSVTYFPRFDSIRPSIINLNDSFDFTDSGAMKVETPEYIGSHSS